MTNKYLIRTRFAPSPTGNLHVGGARTALFNYLFAKKHKGEFILRIEDTDQSRSFEEYAKQQYEDLCWLGLEPDISPYKKTCSMSFRQTERIGIYKKYLDILLQKKKAYFCFCSKNDLEKEKNEYILKNGKQNYKYSRKCFHLDKKEILKKIEKNDNFSIRFLVDNEKDYEINDTVRGKIVFSGKDIEDFVICRKNGIPLLNFAVVIDDHEMKISHIIRAEEHISNTAKQIAVYESFGWDIPFFSHISIIVNSKRKKISKRDKESNYFTINNLKKMGYLPEAVNNYLLFLGWNPKLKEKEIFSLKEMIDFFDFERFNSRPSVFSLEKLNWINNKWIRLINDERFDDLLNDFTIDLNLKYPNKKTKIKLFSRVFRNQINNFSEISDLVENFLSEKDFPIFYLESDLKAEILNFYNDISLIEDWTEENLQFLVKEKTKNLKKEKKKDFLLSLRKIFTGIEKGPEIYVIVFLIGKETVINKLSNFLNN